MSFNIRWQNNKKFQIFFLVMLLLILFVNEFSIKLAFSNVIIGYSELIVIRLFDVILFFNIIFFSAAKKESKIYKLVVRILVNLLAALASFTIILALFELILSTGLFDGLDKSSPVWIPAKYHRMDDEINRKNFDYSYGNPFLFTDRPRSLQSPQGINKRIVVIGDSYVWGYGLPYESAWSHKLEKLVIKNDSTIELMSFGRNSWSTEDEFNFFTEYGKEFENIDLVIFSWITNDPSIERILRKDRFGGRKNLKIHLDKSNLDRTIRENIIQRTNSRKSSTKLDFCRHIFPNSFGFLAHI